MRGTASFKTGMAGRPVPPGEIRATRLPLPCWLLEPHGHSCPGSHSSGWKERSPSVTSQRMRRMRRMRAGGSSAELSAVCECHFHSKPTPLWGLRGPAPERRLASRLHDIRETQRKKVSDYNHPFGLSVD